MARSGSWQAPGTHLPCAIAAELVHTQEGQTNALGDAGSSHCRGSLSRKTQDEIKPALVPPQLVAYSNSVRAGKALGLAPSF
jgi:hypothetical protein